MKVEGSQKTKTPSPWYDSGIRMCIYLTLILVPIAFAPMFYSVFSTPKLLILRLLTLTMVLLWGCKVYVEGHFSYRKSRLNPLLLIYGFVSILNVFFSIAPFTSLLGAQGRFMGIFTVLNFLLLTFIVMNFLTEESHVKKAVDFSLKTAAALSVYGLLQCCGAFKDILSWSADPTERVFSTFGHGNHFGAYLAMNIVLAVYAYTHVKKGAFGWLLHISIGLMVFMLFMTGSRGALVAAVAALLISFGFVLAKRWTEIRQNIATTKVKVRVIVILLLIVTAIIVGIWQKLPIFERTVTAIVNINEGAIPDRLSWWMSSLSMIKDKPFLGFGLSTFRDVFNAYRRTDYVTLAPGEMHDMITPEAAHNELLNIAATQGLIGLIALMAIIIFTLCRTDTAVVLAKKPDSRFYLVLGIKGAVYAFILQAFVNFGEVSTMSYFYVLLGMAAAMTESVYPFRSIKIGRVWAAFTAVGIIFISCAGGYLAVRQAAAEYFYKQAVTAEARNDLRTAIQDYQKAVLASPNEYAYRQVFADFALKKSGNPALSPEAQLNMLRLAEANYTLATEINQFHPSVYYNLGLTHLSLYKMTGNEVYYIKGLSCLHKAVLLAVNNPLYPYQAGKILMEMNVDGSKKEGKAMMQKAMEIRPGYRDAEQLLNATI